MYSLLRYDVSTSWPFPLQASLAGHEPHVVTLTLVASNPNLAPDQKPGYRRHGRHVTRPPAKLHDVRSRN